MFTQLEFWEIPLFAFWKQGVAASLAQPKDNKNPPKSTSRAMLAVSHLIERI